MIEKIFYNVFILGTIISIFILPILIFLSKNKYKYRSRNIYKLFSIILLLLFLPTNAFNFSNIKNSLETTFKTTPTTVIAPPILSNNNAEFEEIKEKNVNIIQNNTVEVENDILYEIFSILPYIWLGISLLVLVYNILNYVWFSYKLKLKNIDIDLQKISIDIGLNKKVLCYTSEKVLSPMSIGIFKNKIVLPADVVINSDYEAILKHELFHIKSKDILCKLLLLLLNCIYWFNPIIYDFTNQFDEILELNCDENVLNGQNDDYRIHYAELLLNQIEKNRSEKYSFSLNFANRRKNIMNRFSNIVDKSNKKGTIRLATVLTILLILALVVILSVPTINFATMPEDANTSDTKNLVALDEPAKKEEPAEQEPTLVEGTKTEVELTLQKPLQEYVLVVGFYGETHKGVDLAALNGTKIYASADGTVKQSSYDGAYGNRIIIEHTNGVTTSYSQCAELLVNEGDTVEAGDVIAIVGSTGNSTGPHLHFEITKDGTLVDPETYISF